MSPMSRGGEMSSTLVCRLWPGTSQRHRQAHALMVFFGCGFFRVSTRAVVVFFCHQRHLFA